jgi:hypothetical protein
MKWASQMKKDQSPSLVDGNERSNQNIELYTVCGKARHEQKKDMMVLVGLFPPQPQVLFCWCRLQQHQQKTPYPYE